MKKKIAIAVTALTLVASFVVGGSLAWLVDTTDGVTNTFTFGDINIELWEHVLNSDGLTLSDTETSEDQSGFKMIPGNTIEKDPTITVKEDSEACWLFVKIVKSPNFDSFMTYELDSIWTNLETSDDGLTSVYYYNGTDLNSILSADKDFNILANKKVTVNGSVTKETLTADTFKSPTLTFTAYAVQRDADIAEVSSQYIRQQILQQASATLLSTANQSPSIALQLI